MKVSYAYDFGRDLRPGDVFMVSKSSLGAYAGFAANHYVEIGYVSENDGLTSLNTSLYSDYVFLFMVTTDYAIAPFAESYSGTSPGVKPTLGNYGSTDLNQYNCTAPIVELQHVSNSCDFTGTIDGVTKLINGLFFIGKISASINNASTIERSININRLGNHSLLKYDYVGHSYENLGFTNKSISYDTYYPFLYYDDTWYILSESVISSNMENP